MLIIGVAYINQKKDIKYILNEIEDVLNEINSKYPKSDIITGGAFN